MKMKQPVTTMKIKQPVVNIDKGLMEQTKSPCILTTSPDSHQLSPVPPPLVGHYSQ